VTTFCPHCREEVDASELIDMDDAWTCFNCGHANVGDAGECEVCGLSADTSEYFEERD
jgi:hypothetical protein